MLIMSSCCECPPAKGCIYRDEFTGKNIGWDDYGSDGTEGGGGYSIDKDNEWAEATGSGSFTRVAISDDPPKKIYVSAKLIDDGLQSESGVTVRRADSDKNISLVRVWGDSDAYELREGSAALASFVATGEPVIKLEITDALSGSTDIKCYVDGAVAHTENGVSFDAPLSLNLGLICSGGGRWDWVEMSPCPLECYPYIGCGEMLFPNILTLQATGAADKCWCSVVNGEFLLSNKYSIMTVGYVEQTLTVASIGWSNVTTLPCQYVSVLESPEACGARPQNTANPTPSFPPLASTTPNPEHLANPCRDDFGEDCFPTSFFTDFVGPPEVGLAVWVLTLAIVSDELSPGKIFVQVTASCFLVTLGLDPLCQYTKDIGPFDLTPGGNIIPIEGNTYSLDFLNSDTIWDSECGPPPDTVEVTFGGGSERIKKMASGCLQTCEPPLDPGKFYTLRIDDGTGSGCSANDALFNETTFSWEWHWGGEIYFDLPGPDPPAPYPCADPNEPPYAYNINYAADLTCYEKNEGEGKRWWLDFGGDITGSLEWNVENDTASGEVKICGEDAVIGAIAQECVPEDHPLATCCPNGGLQLCCAKRLRVSGDIICNGTLVCPGDAEASDPVSLGQGEHSEAPAGWQGADVWWGDMPFVGPNGTLGKLGVKCDGGSMTAARFSNDFSTLIEDLTSESYQCDDLGFQAVFESDSIFTLVGSCCFNAGDDSRATVTIELEYGT